MTEKNTLEKSCKDISLSFKHNLRMYQLLMSMLGTKNVEFLIQEVHILLRRPRWLQPGLSAGPSSKPTATIRDHSRRKEMDALALCHYTLPPSLSSKWTICPVLPASLEDQQWVAHLLQMKSGEGTWSCFKKEGHLKAFWEALVNLLMYAASDSGVYSGGQKLWWYS